jgi:hypothetical protein
LQARLEKSKNTDNSNHVVIKRNPSFRTPAELNTFDKRNENSLLKKKSEGRSSNLYSYGGVGQYIDTDLHNVSP